MECHKRRQLSDYKILRNCRISHYTCYAYSNLTEVNILSKMIILKKLFKKRRYIFAYIIATIMPFFANYNLANEDVINLVGIWNIPSNVYPALSNYYVYMEGERHSNPISFNDNQYQIYFGEYAKIVDFYGELWSYSSTKYSKGCWFFLTNEHESLLCGTKYENDCNPEYILSKEDSGCSLSINKITNLTSKLIDGYTVYPTNFMDPLPFVLKKPNNKTIENIKKYLLWRKRWGYLN